MPVFAKLKFKIFVRKKYCKIIWDCCMRHSKF
jgi:hypothetical protein